MFGYALVVVFYLCVYFFTLCICFFKLLMFCMLRKLMAVFFSYNKVYKNVVI